MRRFSTISTIDSAEPTLLAVGEILVAMSITLVLAVVTDSTVHIAISVCIAPFLLMRSQCSIDLGRTLFEKFQSRANLFFQKFGAVHIYQIAYYPAFLVASLVIKCYATLRYPLSGIKSIPHNWQRVVLCTDSFSRPELVPGTGTLVPEHPHFGRGIKTKWSILLIIISLVTIWAALWLIKKPGLDGLGFLLIYGSSFIILLIAGAWACFLTAWMYRFALKSTALLWLPLIYVAKSSFRKDLPLELRISIMRNSAIWILIRGFAWLTIAAMSFKVLILPEFIELWNAQSWSRILNVYVMPNTIHMWHITATVNAAIALATYYLLIDPAPEMLNRLIWSAEATERKIELITFIRGIFSLYTIMIGIYLTIQAIPELPLPPIDPSFLPQVKN